MLSKKNEDISWLEFEHLSHEKKIQHRIYLKHGGYSQGCYESLNFSYNVGDDKETVRNNFEKIKTFHPNIPLVFGKYSHGNDIFEVKSNCFETNQCYDALVTEIPYIGLSVTHADCQAAIIYDPIRNKLANVHCGWRGNVAHIYTKTIQYMKVRWGCRPQNMLVGISPSLGPEHAEFIHYQREFPKKLHSFVDTYSKIDLWKMSEEELISNKILQHHIEIAQICTYANSKNYFSFRRDKTTGRHLTVVYLKE